MKFRRTDSPEVASAKAGFSTASAYRIEQDPRLKSHRQLVRGRRQPDPLAGIFDEGVVPMLMAAPGLRSVTLYEELMRRHPESVARSSPDTGAPGARLACGAWPRPGDRLSPSPPTGPDGSVGFHRHGRSPDPGCRGAAEPPALPFPTCVIRLSARPCGAGGREFHRPGGRPAERSVDPGWCTPGSSHAQPVGGVS